MILLGFERRWAGVIARTILPLGSFGGVADGRDVAAGIAEQTAGAPWFAGRT